MEVKKNGGGGRALSLSSPRKLDSLPPRRAALLSLGRGGTRGVDSKRTRRPFSSSSRGGKTKKKAKNKKSVKKGGRRKTSVPFRSRQQAAKLTLFVSSLSPISPSLSFLSPFQNLHRLQGNLRRLRPPGRDKGLRPSVLPRPAPPFESQQGGGGDEGAGRGRGAARAAACGRVFRRRRKKRGRRRGRGEEAGDAVGGGRGRVRGAGEGSGRERRRRRFGRRRCRGRCRSHCFCVRRSRQLNYFLLFFGLLFFFFRL